MMRLGRRATLLVALSLLHLGRDKLRRGGVGVWNSGDLLAERLDPHRSRRDWHWSKSSCSAGRRSPTTNCITATLGGACPGGRPVSAYWQASCSSGNA